MSIVEQKLEGFFISLHGPSFRRIHEALTGSGLTEKDNNKTILYHFGQSADGENSLAAIRKDPAYVFSFPKSYWQPRRTELNQATAAFTFNELKPPNPSSQSEKDSAQQILVSDATIDRILDVIRVHIAPRVNP